MKLIKVTKAALLLSALLLVGATGASADMFSSTLASPNAGLSVISGPYGTVTVDLTSSTVSTIAFATDPDFLFAGSGAAGVNINATSWTISDLTGTPLSGFSGPSFTDTGSGNVSSFGTIDQTFQEFDGFAYGLNSISFTVTDNSGTWANAASVLAANSDGYDATAHIFVCSNGSTEDPGQGSCVVGNGAYTTGFAGEAGGATPVPEPATLALFGSGLFGIAGLLRRKLFLR